MSSNNFSSKNSLIFGLAFVFTNIILNIIAHSDSSGKSEFDNHHVSAVTCTEAEAQTNSVSMHIYTAQQLNNAARIYMNGIRAIFEDIKKDIPLSYSSYKIRARAVSLEMPLEGYGFFGFVAYPQQQKVVAPIDAIKLFDDLATAIAYRDYKGCDLISPIDYIGILAVQPGIRRLTPFEAMGIPANILETNRQVYIQSGKILKSAIYFILAHELAHVLFNHKGNNQDYGISQAEERDADAFALATIKNAGGTGTIPMGMVYFFMMTRRLNILNVQTTHPFSHERAAYISQQINADPGGWGIPANLAIQIAQWIAKIATESRDPTFRDLHSKRSANRKLESLRTCSAWQPTVCAGEDLQKTIALMQEAQIAAYNCGLKYSANLEYVFRCIAETTQMVQSKRASLPDVCKQLFDAAAASSNTGSPGSSGTQCVGGVCCDGSGCY